MKQLVSVRSEGGLGEIADLLHDRPFQVEDVKLDVSQGVAQVHFPVPNAQEDAASTGWLRGRMASHNYGASRTLVVNYVSEMILEESEGIGIYEFNTLKFYPELGELHLLTGIPLQCIFKVRRLEVKVYEG